MLYILNSKQETVGVAVNGSPFALPYFDDFHTEDTKGVSTFEFKIPADHEEAGKIEGNGHIIKRDLDGNHLLFTIKNISEAHSDGKKIKEVFCENTAIDELLTDVQRPVKFNSITLHDAAYNFLANSSGWSLNNVEDTNAYEVIIEEYMTVLEALVQVTSQFGFEMFFTVKLNGTQIVEKQVNIVKQRGEETGVRFEYGYNLVGVSRTEDTSGVVTALVGVGKGETSGERITLAPVESFTDGDYYKPVNTDWIGSKAALQRWSKNGQHIFGIYLDDKAETPEALKLRTIKELGERSQPYLQYSCSVLTLERMTGYEAQKLRVGDRIVVKDSTFKPAIVISARVKEIVRSETDPTQDSIDLGSYKSMTISTDKNILDLQKTISKNEAVWQATSHTIVIHSSKGDTFRNGEGSTTLTAKVFKAGSEVDLDGSNFIYRWIKYNADGSIDNSFSHAGKTLTITGDNVLNSATFQVEVSQ